MYKIAVEPKPGYLHISVSGDNTPETLAGYLRDVHAACECSGCARVLIEEHLMGPSLSIADLFEVLSQRMQGIHSVVRSIAYVDRNPRHDASVIRFGENVAVNRGVNARVFAELREAQAWLDAQAGSA